MDALVIVAQLVIALGVLNVWLLRSGRASPWRGAGAASLRAEFAAYGLSSWMMTTVGVLKISLACALILGLWHASLTRPAALGMALLMLGAVAMHVKIGDAFQKSLPALGFLVLSLFVAIR